MIMKERKQWNKYDNYVYEERYDEMGVRLVFVSHNFELWLCLWSWKEGIMRYENNVMRIIGKMEKMNVSE